MFTRKTFSSRFGVIAAALLMSSIAVGAAVGPGVGSAHPLVNVTYA